MDKSESPCHSHRRPVRFKRSILWHQQHFQDILGQPTDGCCSIALSAKCGVSNNGDMGNLPT